MLKILRAAIAPAAILLLIVGYLLIGTSSVSYKKCQSYKADYQADPSYNSSPRITRKGRIAFFFECEAYFSDQNNGMITAFATIAIAGFTLILWRATTEQGRVTGRVLDLARNEFYATHRPQIIVRAFQMWDTELTIGKRPNFLFTAHNIGSSSGRIIEVRSATLVLRDKEKIPNDLGFPFREEFNYILENGQRELIPGNGGSVLVDNQAMEIYGGSHVLLCFGTVAYLDSAGIRRETGFCRRYRSREREWDTITESEYEYAY